MNWIDFVLATVIFVIVGCAAWYVRRSAKKGKKCIGCPDDCSGNCANCRK